MGRRLKNINLVLEESDNSPQSSGDSPRAAVSTSTSNRSRRSVQKRVVSVPIKDVQRLSAPPPDSWAWRKYGQKPIKGSPYPRGYYRCSSSKGCPARKQVERSKVDPDMIMVTYSCDHNHASPPPATSRSNLHRTAVAKSSMDSVSEDEMEEEDDDGEEELEEQEGDLEIEKSPGDATVCKSEEITQSEDKLNTLMDGTLTHGGEFGWLDDFGESPLFESPILMEEDRMVFPMGEEEESLFADLGELPECSTVFRRGMAAEAGRRSLATTTG